MAEVSDRPTAPVPPSDSEVRALAKALGVSFAIARVIAGQAALDGTKTVDGRIITA